MGRIVLAFVEFDSDSPIDFKQQGNGADSGLAVEGLELLVFFTAPVGYGVAYADGVNGEVSKSIFQ